MDASSLMGGSLHFRACPPDTHPQLRPQAWRKRWPVVWVSVGCGHHGVTLGHEPQSSATSCTGRFGCPQEGRGLGRGLAALPKSQCAVTLAQSGKLSKSNMTRPQVLTAKNTQVIPMTFIISPVFIWKKTGSESAPSGLPGCQNKGEWALGTSTLGEGNKGQTDCLLGLPSPGQALCSPHPPGRATWCPVRSTTAKAAWETGRTGGLFRPIGTFGKLGLREARE